MALCLKEGMDPVSAECIAKSWAQAGFPEAITLRYVHAFVASGLAALASSTLVSFFWCAGETYVQIPE